MSEHTQGKLIAKYEWLVPEAHQDRPIGNSSNPIHDRDNYAQVIAQVRGRYHDQDANARRLAAAWNACEGMPTEDIEELAACQGVMTLTVYADDILSELNAARALLREALESGLSVMPVDFSRNPLSLESRVSHYLDACDKPGEPT